MTRTYEDYCDLVRDLLVLEGTPEVVRKEAQQIESSIPDVVWDTVGSKCNPEPSTKHHHGQESRVLPPQEAARSFREVSKEVMNTGLELADSGARAGREFDHIMEVLVRPLVITLLALASALLTNDPGTAVLVGLMVGMFLFFFFGPSPTVKGDTPAGPGTNDFDKRSFIYGVFLFALLIFFKGLPSNFVQILILLLAVLMVWGFPYVTKYRPRSRLL